MAESVAIIGVGLIGGSIGQALRAQGVRVVGIGRHASRLDEAKQLGAIDEFVTGEDLAQALRSVSVAVVCTPVDRIAQDALRIAHAGPANLLVTDAGSTKRALVEAIEADERGRSTFVGAHPIAGSERQGVAFARGDMFLQRTCVLTPTSQTSPELLERARRFWTSIGCRLIELDPVTHDQQLAFTSHLPHALASALASLIPPELLPLAAGAYRDGTRVAGADAELWSSIFQENREGVLAALGALRTRLDLFETALKDGNPVALYDWWEVGRQHRLAFVNEIPRNPVASNDACV